MNCQVALLLSTELTKSHCVSKSAFQNERFSVAIAHGYAKISGKPLGVLLHSNVGLMHASMAIFNAWCERVPMLIYGGNGPMDADTRRPWVDWTHTSADQAALGRHFIKWDKRPASLPAAAEAMLRTALIATQSNDTVYRSALACALRNARPCQ